MQFLTPEQVNALIEAAREDRFHALYVLAVTTGLRQGEFLGLQWDNIDLGCAILPGSGNPISPRLGSAGTSIGTRRPGSYSLRARAMDERGNTQPVIVPWRS
jgi:integrase